MTTTNTTTRWSAKRTWALALALAMALVACLATMPSDRAHAATDAGLKAGSSTLTAQGNNSFYSATNLGATDSITTSMTELGNSGYSIYEDWYRVNIPKTGFFQVSLNAPYVDKYFVNGPWFLELRDSSNRILWYGARGNMGGDYMFFQMGLPKGTYYLCLSCTSVPYVTYTLHTGWGPRTDWEHEPANDYMNTADTLTLGKAKCGSIYGNLDMGSNVDRDWYRLRVSSSGLYVVNFGSVKPRDVSNPWFLVDLYDANGNWKWGKTCAADGYGRDVATLNMKAGTYYMKVTGARYMDAAHYELKVSKVAKRANPMVASGKTVKTKYSRKYTRTVSRAAAMRIGKSQGKLTYKKVSGNSKIVLSKAGKLSVRKGLKRGTYRVKVKVRAAGNARYKAVTKTVTITVKVR